MTYDHTVYQALVHLEVPKKIALALADSASPVKVVAPQAAPAALAGGADLPTTVAAFNALRTALINAGVLT